MRSFSISMPVLAISAGLMVTMPLSAMSSDVQTAVDLVKQTHSEQCQKSKIKVQLLLAHQSHDQSKMNALGPELEAISKRLKPVETQLEAIKARIKKNPDDQSAFESALLELGDCE